MLSLDMICRHGIGTPPDDYGYFGDHGNETLLISADLEMTSRNIGIYISCTRSGNDTSRQYLTETDNDDISYSEGLAGAIVIGDMSA